MAISRSPSPFQGPTLAAKAAVSVQLGLEQPADRCAYGLIEAVPDGVDGRRPLLRHRGARYRELTCISQVHRVVA